MKVSVIGSGSWGTALSQAIVDNGHELLLYARTEKARDEINIEHTNKRYLKDAVLPNEIVATSDLSEAVTFADVIVIAVPTKVMRETARKINEYLEKPKYIIHVSKGLEMETNKRMSEVIKDEIISDNLKGVGVLSGPSHAEELILRNPTVVAIASENDELNKLIGISGSDLREINLSNSTISAAILSDVVDFELYDKENIVYIEKKTTSNDFSVGLRKNDKNIEIAKNIKE